MNGPNGPGDLENIVPKTKYFSRRRKEIRIAEQERKKKEEEKKKKEAEIEERKRSFSLLTGYTPPNVARRTLLPGDTPFPLATV